MGLGRGWREPSTLPMGGSLREGLFALPSWGEFERGGAAPFHTGILAGRSGSVPAAHLLDRQA
jgi:hypothetical protein